MITRRDLWLFVLAAAILAGTCLQFAWLEANRV